MDKYKPPKCAFPGCGRDGTKLIREAFSDPKRAPKLYCPQHFIETNEIIDDLVEQIELEQTKKANIYKCSYPGCGWYGTFMVFRLVKMNNGNTYRYCPKHAYIAALAPGLNNQAIEALYNLVRENPNSRGFYEKIQDKIQRNLRAKKLQEFKESVKRGAFPSLAREGYNGDSN